MLTVFVKDDDECVPGSHMCDDVQGICHNNAGSYTCTCATGYQIMDGETEGYVCEDIDECLGSNMCHADATSDNTVGSYTGTCNTDYEDFDASAFSGSGDHVRPPLLTAKTVIPVSYAHVLMVTAYDDKGVTCFNEDECLDVYAQNECYFNLATILKEHTLVFVLLVIKVMDLAVPVIKYS